MRKYRPMIIGCGKQGVGEGQQKNDGKIINFADAFSRHPGFDDIWFADRDNWKAIQASSEWNGIYTENYRHSLYNHEFDTVVIATPDDSHYKILKHLTEYPLELVICEKPLCTDLDQAREIVNLYHEKDIPLMVNYTRRFLPYYDHLKQYGKPVYGTCAFNRGWLHTATHAIDFFNMIGLDNYRMIEIPSDTYRVWDLKAYYQDHVFSEVRTVDMPVWDYYDKSHWYIAENAFEFLEYNKPLLCTGEDALKALEICFKLMEEK